jgi:hypothetical protein
VEHKRTFTYLTNNFGISAGYIALLYKNRWQVELFFSSGSFAPPDGSVYFHNITGDRWGNIYLLVRGKGGDQKAILKSGQGKRISILKYNNNADFVTEWSFSDPNHRETTAAVDSDGVVYALFVTETEMGVEIFIEE